jgi:uncharacterized protein YcsI (UPF0317 family)
MTNLRKVRAAARKIGATVQDDRIGHSHTCRVEAPSGMIWSCGDLHELVDDTNQPWKPDYEDVLARMSYGVEPCPLGDDCEWCHPEEETEQ